MDHFYRVKKCNRCFCKICNNLLEFTDYIEINKLKLKINSNISCYSPNIIFVLMCSCCYCFAVDATSLSLSKMDFVFRNDRALSHFKFCCNMNYFLIPLFKVATNSELILIKQKLYFINLLKPTLNFPN